jgi:hypothetical protein
MNCLLITIEIATMNDEFAVYRWIGTADESLYTGGQWIAVLYVLRACGLLLLMIFLVCSIDWICL